MNETPIDGLAEDIADNVISSTVDNIRVTNV